MSWTFGLNLNDDVVALAPKKGPFCQYNHSREADGELTSDQLSKRKMISEAKKRIRLDKAAQSAANVAEEEGEEAQLSVEFGYLTTDSEEDEDYQDHYEANVTTFEEADDGSVSPESSDDDGDHGDGNELVSETPDDNGNQDNSKESVSEIADGDNDQGDGNSAPHLNSQIQESFSSHSAGRAANDPFEPRIANESKIAGSDSRVRATP
jgi:hypothetical protein